MPDPAGGIGWGVWSLWILLAYLLGSAPVGYLAARSLKGIDIREHGSRNPGAANVARVVGKGAGLFTLFADILKGWAPAFLALRAYPEWNVFPCRPRSPSPGSPPASPSPGGSPSGP